MWDKYQQLINNVKTMERVVVAFSGGIDSTLLLKAAHDALGDNAIAVLGTSPTIPEEEQEEARCLAEHIGARLVVMDKHEMDDPRFVANTPQRCYYCKALICEVLQAYAAEHGYKEVLDGSNADDLDDFRPGHRAAKECGMRSPLQQAGLTKAEIRALAKELGLPNWDKPSSACLVSRIPYHTSLTVEAIQQIAQSEAYLHSLGIRQLRVRHHDQVARIEVPAEDFAVVMARSGEIVQTLKTYGYSYVTLDLSGFRSGSMNDVLGSQDKG